MLVIASPCTVWCAMENLNPDQQKVRALQEEERVLLEPVEQMVKLQPIFGVHVLVENPVNPTAWKEGPLLRLREKLYEFTSNQCSCGIRGPRGGFHRNPTRYLSDSKDLADALSVNSHGTH